MRAFGVFLLLAATAAPSGAAVSVRAPHGTARLICDHDALSPGGAFRAGFLVYPDPGWHVYWVNPGDSGSPPSLTWNATAGTRIGEPLWPVPRRLPLGGLVNYGYERELLLATPMRAPEGAPPAEVQLRLKAEWLVCKEECVPASAEFALTLPVRKAAVPSTRWKAAFERAERRLPRDGRGLEASAEPAGERLVLRAEGIAPAAFFPLDAQVIENAARQTAADGALTVQRAQERDAWPARLRGVLVDADGAGWTVEIPVGAPPPSPPAALAAALGLAFLGGLLLNLMPCVLPILSIKALGLMQGASRRRAGLYAIGEIVSFLALGAGLLALRAGGSQIGWGFQLQSPLFSGALAALFLVLGFNLFGYFEIGLGLTRLGGTVSHDNDAGAFLSGVLAVVVATPCTAPFMGAALGAAVTMPPAGALAVFAALGVGMALPVAILAARPDWSRLLPKPGPWMETLKEGLAFPMFATAAWLYWVHGIQIGIPWLGRAVGALTAAGAAVWTWRRFSGGGAGRALACAAGLASLAIAFGPAAPEDVRWEPWSDARRVELLAMGRPVFVDFTAAWCVTCQVNERGALSSDAFRRAALEANAALLKADWTARDPEITAALAALGRNGVPVYALYRPGRETPRLLPSVLTPGLAAAAMRELQ